MALSVKDPETERLRRVGSDARKAALLEDLAASRRRRSALPVLDTRNADEIIGYAENGLPGLW
jgi:antitoxin VapB